jgi:hypothetical protein
LKSAYGNLAVKHVNYNLLELNVNGVDMEEEKAKFEYKSECACLDNRRVRAYFRYPVGAPFGDFYAELAECCRDFLAREYSSYSGRGLSYRFCADVIYSESGMTSVVLSASLNEKGLEREKRNFLRKIGSRMVEYYRFLPYQTRS